MNFPVPEFLIKMLEEQYGKQITEQIIKGYQLTRKTTFRINNIKTSIEEIINTLKEKKIEYETVEWSKEAFILKNVSETEVKNLKIYQDGKIYLQSLSSMLPPILLEPKSGMDILDMTAAPGGKTTQIASITRNQANITACEKNKIRAQRLKYNLEKQGAKVYLMTQDARNIDDFFSFDQILLDAPCSGSGIIQIENKKLEQTFTPQLIKKSVETQAVLIKKAISLLKKGKEMIYSTCSILKQENEEIIQLILKDKKAEIIPISKETIEKMQEIPTLPTKIKGTLCVCPNNLYEGFFIAKIRKN